MAIKDDNQFSKAFFSRWSEKEKKPSKYVDIPLFQNFIGWDLLGAQKCIPIPMTKSYDDLMTIAVTVAYIDRVFRRPKRGWDRNITADISVFEIDRRSSHNIIKKLEKCLSLLTQDTWHIRFHIRLHQRCASNLSMRYLPKLFITQKFPTKRPTHHCL